MSIGSRLLNQVQAAMLSSGSNKATVSEGVEASIIYVRFKAAASEVLFLCISSISSSYNAMGIEEKLLARAVRGVGA